MSEINPPLILEAGSHDADLLRQLWEDTYTPGVMGADHLEVTEQATPALGVTVAAGRAFVAGDESSTQGVYYVSNSADVDVALATADATNDRIDLIVARVKDSFYSGGDDEWDLEAVTGTPSGAPVAPAAPANSYVLAEVLVPADPGGNPAITDSDITDMRAEATLPDRLGHVWQDWTPTFGNLTLGDGTQTARYTQAGKLVVAEYALVFGSGSAMGSNPTVSLPVTGVVLGGNQNNRGTGVAHDANANARYPLAVRSTDTVAALHFFTGSPVTFGAIGATAPFTWTTSDVLQFSITYEAA
jgi:hypothetical protein